MAAAANPAAGLPTGSAREKLRSQTLGPVPIAGSSGTGPIFAASTGPPMLRGFGLVGEGARAATLQPKFERVAVGTVELLREIKEGAVQQRAVVVGELYEPGLGDEPAELDQMFGARAPCHDPLTIVVPRSCPTNPVEIGRASGRERGGPYV